MMNILHFFDYVQGSDTAPTKPSPEMLLKAASAIDSKIENTWMVGDSHVDILASKAAGCISIGVNYHKNISDSMIKENPDFVIESLAELTELGEIDEYAK